MLRARSIARLSHRRTDAAPPLPRQAAAAVAGHLPVDRRARRPEPPGDLDHGDPGLDFQDGLIALLHDAQLRDHEPEQQQHEGLSPPATPPVMTGSPATRTSPT